MARPKKTPNKKASLNTPVYANYVDRLENQVQSNQSKLSMVLGALIILVVGILIYNYFNRDKGADLGPAQQTQQLEEDVSPENLPGKYTIKSGDTLFKIAEKYYGDGHKYPEIAKINKLTNADLIEKGQILEIPKLETAVQPPATESVIESTSAAPGSKGAPDITMTQSTGWGTAITGDKYTVVKGDWLSKIAGRAYGDIFAFDKIAKANSIQNPNLIEPGMILTIPR